MPAIWKYVPSRIGVLDRKSGTFHPSVPVTVKRGPGQEHDEVVAKWKSAPPRPQVK